MSIGETRDPDKIALEKKLQADREAFLRSKASVPSAADEKAKPPKVSPLEKARKRAIAKARAKGGTK